MTLEGIIPKGEDISIYHRRKTSICKTLCVLNLYRPSLLYIPEINITWRGLLLVLALVENMEELKIHIDKCFEYLAEKHSLDAHFNEGFKLRNILLDTLSKHYPKVLKWFCPHLKSLEFHLLVEDDEEFTDIFWNPERSYHFNNNNNNENIEDDEDSEEDNVNDTELW